MKTLAERIKDLPKGTKLYSPCYGEMTFVESVAWDIILCTDYSGSPVRFGADGSICHCGECMLFPSKDNRDWEKFLVGRNKFDVRTLQPFDKVLTRDEDDCKWTVSIFSFYDETESIAPFVCINRYRVQCIPYNDETKHLLGHCKQAPEYYITWKKE